MISIEKSNNITSKAQFNPNHLKEFNNQLTIDTQQLLSSKGNSITPMKIMPYELEMKEKKKKYTITSIKPVLPQVKHNDKRIDAYGTLISRDKRKHKVTFIDKLNPNQQFSIEEYIESYKEYNMLMTYPVSSVDAFGKKAICSCTIV